MSSTCGGTRIDIALSPGPHRKCRCPNELRPAPHTAFPSLPAGWDATETVGLLDPMCGKHVLVRANTPAYRGDCWAWFLGTERPIASFAACGSARFAGRSTDASPGSTSTGRTQPCAARLPTKPIDASRPPIANKRPRWEPRERWPRDVGCAGPKAKTRNDPGVRLELAVTYVDGRKHLPIVKLKRAA